MNRTLEDVIRDTLDQRTTDDSGTFGPAEVGHFDLRPLCADAADHLVAARRDLVAVIYKDALCHGWTDRSVVLYSSLMKLAYPDLMEIHHSREMIAKNKSDDCSSKNMADTTSESSSTKTSLHIKGSGSQELEALSEGESEEDVEEDNQYHTTLTKATFGLKRAVGEMRERALKYVPKDAGRVNKILEELDKLEESIDNPETGS